MAVKRARKCEMNEARAGDLVEKMAIDILNLLVQTSPAREYNILPARRHDPGKRSLEVLALGQLLSACVISNGYWAR